MAVHDVIIVGGGTAGMSAAIYAARAGRSVLLLESGMYGGQIIASEKIENYPAIASISGSDFALSLLAQVQSLGVKTVQERVVALEDGAVKTVVTTAQRYPCRAVVLATGQQHRTLGVEREAAFVGHGVSYCAVCDGMFFRGREVAIVGGGSTALQDAAFLANYCAKVTLIHRRREFRGEAHLLRVLQARENVVIRTDARVVALHGEAKLTGITVQDTQSGEESLLEVSGLFVAIGQTPNNEAFRAVVQLDQDGYIVADEKCATSAAGIFAAGDCRTKTVRQLTTAAADGAVAGLAAANL